MERANEAVKKLEAYCERPFITPSIGVLKGVEAIGKPRRLGILTPYFGPAGEMVANFFRSAGYEAARVVNMEAKGPTNVAKISFDTIRAAVDALDAPEVEAFVHVGTALCVSGLTAGIEKKHGKPLIGVNVATYWAALRAAGVRDALPGFGLRFCLAPVQAIIFSLEPGAHSRINTFYNHAVRRPVGGVVCRQRRLARRRLAGGVSHRGGDRDGGSAGAGDLEGVAAQRRTCDFSQRKWSL